MTSNALDPDEASVTISSTTSIEFALWVLLQDGLHVPSFGKHTGGNQLLQSLGMTPASWYEWLELILIKRDNRLSWHVPDIDARVKEHLESFKKLIGMVSEAHGIDYNAVHGQVIYDDESQDYQESLISQELGYQQALLDYQGLDTNLIKQSSPPELYPDNPQVKERLILLWQEYGELKSRNEFIESAIATPIAWNVQINPPALKHRQIYLVDYPFEVEIFIPPVCAIVTVPNRPVERSILDQRMFSVLQNS